MPRGKLSALDFQFGECIGEGSYSKVYRGVLVRNQRTYAIKVLSKAHIQRENKRKYVTIERDTLNILGKHPGIVTLYYTFQDQKSLYFVIDYAHNGELLSLVRRLGSLSEKLSRYYMIQLVDALEFVHSKGIIHRDLKPENILLGQDWRLMITDFGAAKIFTGDKDQKLPNKAPAATADDSSAPKRPPLTSDDSTASSTTACNRADSFVGTAEYVSPELLRFNECGFEADLWALGCVAYQLIVGMPPFKGGNEYETFEKIVGLQYAYPSNYFVSDNIKDFISHLLVVEPKERYTFKQVRAHPWFAKVNWSNKRSIWNAPVPKLEPYNARQSEMQFRLRESPHRKPQHASPKDLSSVPGFFPETGAPVDNIPKAVSSPAPPLRVQMNQQQGNVMLMNRVAARGRDIRNFVPQRQQPPPVMGPLTSRRVQQQQQPQQPQQPLNFVSRPHLENAPAARRNSLQFASSGDTPQQNSAYFRPPILTNQAGQTSVSAPNTPHMGVSSPMHELFHVPQVHPAAVSAAGAAGMLIRKRRQNSEPLAASDYKPPKLQPLQPSLQRKSQEIIETADTQVPGIMTSKLAQGEYIIKLDNILLSRLTNKNQFGPPDGALDDVILNKIISENYQMLNKDLRSCLLIITSAARLFAYFSPQAGEYQQVFEIKLTSKNVSMYDYEFDEEAKEGYLILQLIDSNTLFFLSAYTPDTLVDGGVGQILFKVNGSMSWINALMKAKRLLKKEKQNQNRKPACVPTKGVVEGMRNLKIGPAEGSNDALAAAGAASAASTASAVLSRMQ